MPLQKTYIPYGAYWCSPFAKWQGNLASLHPIKFAADVAKRALSERALPGAAFSGLFLGMTIPAQHSFYGAPWLAGLIGMKGITGPVFSQACATSARVIASAAFEIEAAGDKDSAILCITADKTSNGPHLTYPNPMAPGGRVDAEDWVWDNFNMDPLGRNTMLQTAENVAREYGISTQEQHEVVMVRNSQYQDALKDGAAFHKRYMVSPIDVNPSGRKVIASVTDDEGIFPTSTEGLARLKPVMPDGTVTFGGQTFPADGNAGMVITTRENARQLSKDHSIEIQLLSFAEGRAEQGYMPKANLPAIRRVLSNAGLSMKEITAIKTHNPFAVNDCLLNREFNLSTSQVNNYGCSLIWGHPQGPTGMRLVIELIEELSLSGGGYGLFTGCAAGDTAAALVLKVEVH